MKTWMAWWLGMATGVALLVSCQRFLTDPPRTIAYWVAKHHGVEAHLRGANLAHANLQGAHLYGAELTAADLSGADLRQASLSGAHLGWANLAGAQMSGALIGGRGRSIGGH